MRAEPKGDTSRGGVIAALAVLGGAAAALSGCGTTWTIWPGDLPAVTAVAAKNPKQPVTVHDARGVPETQSGRLDAVVVTRKGEGEVRDHFDAPVLARIDGPWMTVASLEKQRKYTPWEVASVETQRYPTGEAIAGGAVMTGLGTLINIGGGSLIALGVGKNNGLEYIYPMFGVSLLSIGIGFWIGGIPMLTAGTRNPWTSLPKIAPPTR